MARPLPNPRVPDNDIDSQFTDRWSPRAFRSDPLSDDQLASLFEAARWAPSCFNEQPWLFIYATEPDARERFLGALVEKNQQWARTAPMLLFVLARREFAMNGKPNRHAPFDAGAAWMSLALQARKLGLHAHAMAGFSRQRAYEVLGIEESEYNVMAAVAVGYRGEPEELPEEMCRNESPSPRKESEEVARHV